MILVSTSEDPGALSEDYLRAGADEFENPITSLYKKICNETCIFISHPDFC